MTLGPDDVAYIAHLARLEIDPGDVPLYVRNLNEILELVERMGDAPCEGVQPMAHPLHAVQPLREDRVTEGDRREALQKIAPAIADGLYLVPRVIE